MIPEEITDKDLDLLVRVQMKTLSPENAERVARHLAMVNLLMDADPELAHKHALAAADRAGRIGIVRETVGLTAYTIGDFALALREMQAYRRISGKDDQLPIMVDCERGLGRPEKALELGRSVARETLEPGVRVNLAIAMSGARLDRNEDELALAELEIAELNPERVFEYSPHLFRAYADTLEVLERKAEAQKWFKLADRADAALNAKNAPMVEVQDIIEELVIPEP
jgi:tetratricopeptide (TPR) repeat protein